MKLLGVSPKPDYECSVVFVLSLDPSPDGLKGHFGNRLKNVFFF